MLPLCGRWPSAPITPTSLRKVQQRAQEQAGPSLQLGRRGLSFSAALAAAAASAARKAARAEGRGLTRAEVEKSPLDNRLYEPFTLPNGLRVLLCSDPSADRAAAALDVHAGYFNDPATVPGLAHFCEHMLFLGTEPFPEENSFDTYLTANGGFSNAFTEAEDTCFFFSCGVLALKGALQRFGAFFQQPLFTASATGREVNAINSEHLKNVPNDVYRLGQVLNSRANPAHPYHKFGTGNTKTLLEDTSAQGIDLRGELLEYYHRFYRAPLMTLCIIGRESTTELRRYAESFFGGIPGGGPDDPAAAYRNEALFLPEAFQQGAEAVPISDARSLQVVFPVQFLPESPTFERDMAPPAPAEGMNLSSWRWYNPSSHVGAVLGHEGPQSLCALLRRRGWITALDAGSADNTETFAMMLLSLELTSEGLRHQDEILELLFGYLSFLRQLPEFPQELLAENLRLSECGWLTSESLGPQEAATALAGAMQDWPAAFYIAGPARLRKGPGLSGTVAALLERLCVENALITVVSRTCAGNAKLTEPWYGTRFGFRDLRGLRGRLRNAGLGDGLGLPPLNPFLPRSLALKAPRRAPGAFPVPALERTERWDAYFRQDTEHGVPKAYVFVQLLTPLPRGSPELAVAARLYENLVADGLQESLLYYAQVAGLDFNFSISTRGVQLFLGGFDDRLGSFAESALDALLAYKPDPKDFAAQLDVLRRELDSFDSQLPIAQASYWTGLALVVPEIPLEELRRAAAAARPAEVAAFAEQLWRRERLFGTSLCWGNLRQAEADALAAKLQRLDFAPLPPSEWPLPRVAQVPIAPTGPGVVLVHEVMDPAEENSAVELLFQGGSSRGGDPEQMEALAVLQVLASAISDEFYEELRTREQLGYVVSCRADRNEGVFGLLFQVQGAAKSALEVLERIDAFLETVPELLKAKSEAEVAQLADALAEARLARPQSLLGAAQRVWAEIRSREFRWARPAEEALALKKVRKAQVLEAFDTRVASGGALRRRLVSLVVRRGEKARVLAALAKRNAQVIEDLQAFARVQPKWPS